MPNAIALDVPAEHAVRFYEDSVEHIDALAAELAAFVAADKYVIAVARPENLAGLRDRLADRGVDVTRAELDGQLTLRDADEALAGFMVDTVPDQVAFRATIGALVGQRAAKGSLLVYGEMVALLCERGNVTAAIELERFWNELGTQESFGLLCAYAASSVTESSLAEEFDAICRLHSRVLNATPGASDDVSRPFAATERAPGLARDFVADALQRWGWPSSPDALLIVSELATNALQHARTEFRVVLSRTADSLRLAVSDGSDSLPALRPAHTAAPNGRGLHLIEAVCQAWGAELEAGGKVVWATVAAPVADTVSDGTKSI